MASRLAGTALVGLACLTAESASAGRAPEFPHTVRWTIHDRGTIVVPVMIGRAGPFRMLPDTGSTRSAISSRVAARLKAPITGGTLMVTPTGSAPRPVALLPALQIGSQFISGVSAMVLPDKALPHGAQIDGLIGQDVLANHAYTLDYEARALRWHDDTRGVSGIRLRLALSNGLFFVAANGSGLRNGMHLLADSGADALVVFEPESRVSARPDALATGVLRTSTGSRLGREMVVEALELGTITLRKIRALILPDASGHAMLGDGLLPLHLFARVTVDGPGRTLIVHTR